MIIFFISPFTFTKPVDLKNSKLQKIFFMYKYSAYYRNLYASFVLEHCLYTYVRISSFFRYMKNVEAENTTRWRIRTEDLLSDSGENKVTQIIQYIIIILQSNKA